MKKLLYILLLTLPLLSQGQSQLELPYSIKVLNPKPLDAYYFNTSSAPYTNTAQVISQVPSSVRYRGQTFNVNGVEYCFCPGTADGNLVAKIGGASTVAGSDTQIQYNSSGVFGASANLTWDNAHSALSVGPAASLVVTGPVRIHTTGSSSAYSNLFMGGSSGNYTMANTGNGGNVGIGDRTLNSLAPGVASGSHNIALGADAQLSLTTGTANIGIGYQSLYSITTTNGNTAIGASTLTFSTGNNNIALGNGAGSNMTSGNSNLIIGVNIDAASYTTSNQLTIQNAIFGTGNSASGSSISTGNIGIYKNAPSARLHLIAGTATANTAPLKIDGGTLLSAAENYAIEATSSHLYWTSGSGTRYQLDQQAGGGGGGTVTSIGITAGSNISQSGSPITSSGNITVNAIPSGAINQIQFNNGTNFAGSANLLWDGNQLNVNDGSIANFSVSNAPGGFIALTGPTGDSGHHNGGSVTIAGGTPFTGGAVGTISLDGSTIALGAGLASSINIAATSTVHIGNGAISGDKLIDIQSSSTNAGIQITGTKGTGTMLITANKLNLALSKELQLNGSAGTAGQYPASQGSGLPPIWTTPLAAPVIVDYSGDLSGTMSNIQPGGLAAVATKYVDYGNFRAVYAKFTVYPTTSGSWGNVKFAFKLPTTCSEGLLYGVVSGVYRTSGTTPISGVVNLCTTSCAWISQTAEVTFTSTNPANAYDIDVHLVYLK